MAAVVGLHDQHWVQCENNCNVLHNVCHLALCAADHRKVVMVLAIWLWKNTGFSRPSERIPRYHASCPPPLPVASPNSSALRATAAALHLKTHYVHSLLDTTIASGAVPYSRIQPDKLETTCAHTLVLLVEVMGQCDKHCSGQSVHLTDCLNWYTPLLLSTAVDTSKEDGWFVASPYLPEWRNQLIAAWGQHGGMVHHMVLLVLYTKCTHEPCEPICG